MGLLDWFTRPHIEDEPTKEIVVGEESVLGRIDVYSPTWVFVRSWAKDRLQSLREQNDSLSRDQVNTAAIRGEIRALKDVLALPDDQTRRGLLSNGNTD